MIVSEAVFIKDYVLEFWGERTQKYDRKNREWRRRQIKSIYRLYLDLVVKKLYYINCLNAWATIAPLSEIRSYNVVLSFYVKMMKRRTLRACSFKAYYQKRHAFWLGKTGLALVGQGAIPPPPPPPLPPLATHLPSDGLDTSVWFYLMRNNVAKDWITSPVSQPMI